MDDDNPPISKAHPAKERFEALLRGLDPDRNRAGEKYENLRRKLIKFFEWNLCFPAEDLADDTLDRVEQRLGDMEIHDVAGFAWGVAKNVRRETHKAAGRTVYLSDLVGNQGQTTDAPGNEKDVYEKMQQERRFKCLELCLLRMAERDRETFLAYHNVKGERTQYRQALARRLGLTLGTLRVRVNRLRDDLERCARACFASWKIRGSRHRGN